MSRNRRGRRSGLLLGAAMLLPLVGPSANGQPGAATSPEPPVTMRPAEHHDVLPSLQAVPVPELGSGGPVQPTLDFAGAPRAGRVAGSEVPGAGPDPEPTARTSRPAASSAAKTAPRAAELSSEPPSLPTRNYEGPTSLEAERTSGIVGTRADASSGVGPDHVVTFAGGTISALTKSTGAMAYGPTLASSLWSGFGEPCQSAVPTAGRVLYDERASRFVLVAATDPLSAPGRLCVAVSATADPTASWLRSSYELPAGIALEDLLLSAWTDSFVLTARRTLLAAGDSAAGPDESAGANRPFVAVLERAPLLAGTTARMAQVDVSSTDASLERLVPVDLDTPAATGDTGALLAALPGGIDSAAVSLFRLTATWSSSSVAFASGGSVPLEPADVAGTHDICGGETCIQVELGLSPGASYRAVGAGAGRVTLGLTERTPEEDPGMRYIVLATDGAGTPSLAATGAVASADGIARFQPMVSQDASGDLSVAYTTSSETSVLGIAVSGRAASDPPGQLRQEVDLTAGLAVTPSTPRPEPIANVLDPVEGCTAWISGGYTPTYAGLGWSTRIASVPMTGCATSPSGTPPVTFALTPQTGRPPLDVTASVTSQPAADPAPSFAWSFGDGATASGETVQHTYTAAGIYRTTLDIGVGLSHATASRLVAVGTDAPPVAADDEISVKPGTTGYTDVILNNSGHRNDFDPDGGPVQVISNTDPVHGTVSCFPAGACSYLPGEGFTGIDSFSYVIQDDEGDTATAKVRVDVINRPPSPADDGLVTGPSSSSTVDVFDNDHDLDGDALTLVSNTEPAHGSVSCLDYGECTYSPADGYVGPDRFDYTVSDGELEVSSFVDILVTECPDLTGALTPSGSVIADYDWVECASPDAHGTTAIAASGLATDGMGALLTTGAATDAAAPNDATDTSVDLVSEVRGANDVSILQVNLDVPVGANCLAFDAVFASEEYPEFVGSPYNDAFLAELDTNDWSVNGPTIAAPSNFALDSNGGVLSVNSAFFAGVVTRNGTEYDGATPPLRIQTPITPGAHKLFLSIFDASDHILDSAVFVDNLVVGTTAGGCVAGTLAQTTTSIVREGNDLVAKVTGPAPAISGNVRFMVDGAPGATVAVGAGGQAKLPVTSLAPGSHTVVAEYQGSSTHAASSSGPLLVDARAATSTTLVREGDLLAATVTGPAPAISGNVRFVVDNAPGNPVPVGAGGRATMPVSGLAPGVRSVVAQYLGSTTHLASSSAALSVEVAVGSRFTALPPLRILDTRTGIGAPAALVPPKGVVDLQVTDRGGVPADATAVVLNVTAVAMTGAPSSYLTAWPTGEVRPLASNLNYTAREVIPNLVTVKVGAGGKVSLFNDTGSVHLLADVAGYYATGAESAFNALQPERLLDTRTGNGAPAGTVGPAGVVELQITGRGGVPAGATGVVLNVTAVGLSGAPSSYVTAWPTGSSLPFASNLNLVAGQVIPNLVVAKIGTGGKVSLRNDTGNVHLLADVAGYYGATGSTFTPVAPSRLLDTRTGTGAPAVRVPAGGTVELQVTGRGGVTAGATAAVLNVTAVNLTGAGGSWLTVWPTGQPAPLASNLNMVPGQIIPNLVVAKIGVDGKVSISNAAGNIDILADVAGSFT